MHETRCHVYDSRDPERYCFDMTIDWTQLARDVGSLRADGESGGTEYAQRALEQILGEENLQGAVDLVLAYGPGSELAMNVLRHIRSRRATEMAYEAYRSTSGEQASAAVWLIKHIAHPCAIPWIAEFLRDPNVSGWGIGVLDQLLWNRRVEPEEVEALLTEAERHASENVREQAAFIRGYLADRGGQNG
jgi:hypothetical protein